MNRLDVVAVEALGRLRAAIPADRQTPQLEADGATVAKALVALHLSLTTLRSIGEHGNRVCDLAEDIARHIREAGS